MQTSYKTECKNTTKTFTDLPAAQKYALTLSKVGYDVKLYRVSDTAFTKTSIKIGHYLANK